MGLFSWLKGLGGSGRKEAQRRHQKEEGAAIARLENLAKQGHRQMERNARRDRIQSKIIHSNLGNPTHIDAAFDAEEHASFLLGLKIECRSSWIDSAQWNEEAKIMILTVDGKGYDFPGIDYGEAQVFSGYPSKGKWFWQVYRGRLGGHAGNVKGFVVDNHMRLPS